MTHRYVADVAGNNNLTRTKSQYHRTHPGRLVNFSSFRVSSRQQQQQTASHGGGSMVARAMVVGGGRLLSTSALGGHAAVVQQQQQQQSHRQQQNSAADACCGGTSGNGKPAGLPAATAAVVPGGSRENRKTSGVGTSAAVTKALRYCKSVSPIAEKPAARRSPPRSVSMNLQLPRNATAMAAVDSCQR